MLGQIRQDHVGGDRRHLIEPRLAELALHIVLLGETEAAKRLHAHVGGKPGCVGGQQLRHIGLRPDVGAGFVFGCGLVHHQLGRAHPRIGARDRKLHALVLPDRPAEQFALLGVGGGFFDEPFGVADAFRRDQDALGVHAGQDVAEALAFLADQVFRRHPQVVEEHFRGGMVHHGTDRIDADAGALRQPHVDQEHRQAVGALLDLLLRRGARQQQHQVGMLGARGPELLSVDDVVVVAFAFGGRAQRQRVGAGGRLGHAERLQPQFSAGDLRQIALLLRRRTVPKNRSHGVHLRMAGGAVAARGVDFFQDGGGRADAEPAAAKLLRDQRGEIAGRGQRRDEFGRIAALAIKPAPIFARVLGAQRAHAFADVGECVVFGTGFAHDPFTSARPLLIAIASRSITRARKLTTLPSRQTSVRIVSPGNTGAENRPAIAVSRAGS